MIILLGRFEIAWNYCLVLSFSKHSISKYSAAYILMVDCIPVHFVVVACIEYITSRTFILCCLQISNIQEIK